MSSKAQQEWQAMCAAVRAELARKVGLMEAMTPDEVETLVSAIDSAMWNEIKAESHDEAVEERRAGLERQTAFGG